MTTDVLSPVTLIDPTTVELIIKKQEIIEAYKKMQMDVSRFFTAAEEIQIRKCSATGYRFYHPYNIFGDDLFYSDLQGKDAEYYPEDKWEHIQALSYVFPGANVLEIGCATGYFLSLSKAKGATCQGIELNSKAAADARANGLDVVTETYQEHAAKHPHRYDIVCSFQVLEHIHDVNEYFKCVLTCLKPGGLVIIGVPNNNPYIFKHDIYHTLNLPPHHAGLWRADSLQSASSFFKLTRVFLSASKLEHPKDWYLAQIAHYKKTSPFRAFIMKLVPRPVYKFVLKIFSGAIEGKTLLGVFKQG